MMACDVRQKRRQRSDSQRVMVRYRDAGAHHDDRFSAAGDCLSDESPHSRDAVTRARVRLPRRPAEASHRQNDIADEVEADHSWSKPLIVMTEYRVADRCVERLHIVRLGEDRGAQRARGIAALWCLLHDEDQFRRASVIWHTTNTSDTIAPGRGRDGRGESLRRPSPQIDLPRLPQRTGAGADGPRPRQTGRRSRQRVLPRKSAGGTSSLSVAISNRPAVATTSGPASGAPVAASVA